MKQLFFYSFSLAVAIIFLFPILGFSETRIVPLRNAVDPTGLIGYWPLDDNAPNNFIRDYSGMNVNGTSTQNTNLMSTTTAVYGRALYFNGTSDSIKFRNVPDSYRTTQTTISLWVKSVVNDEAMIISGKNNTDLSVQCRSLGRYWPSYNLSIFNTNNCDWAGGGKGTLIPASNNIWQHIVYGSDGSTVYAFKNGQMIFSVSDNLDASLLGYYSLANNPSTSLFFNGSLDDVRIYNRVLSAAEIQTLYQMGSVKTVALKNAVSQSGLIGYWPLDENAPNNFVRDYSGNGNHGTSIQNTNLVSTTTAKYRRAMSFNGTSDYVNIGTNASLNISGAGTISYWFQQKGMPSNETYHSAVNRTDGGYTGYSAVNYYNSTFSFYNTASGGRVNSTYTLLSSDFTWHHYLLTTDGTTMRFYVDGIAKGTGTATFSASTPVSGDIGRFQTLGVSKGIYDDVRIYNRALSAAEIRTLYNMGSVKLQTGASNSGLVGYWPMNEGIGTVINDMSGNRNTGTRVGTTWVQGKFGKALSFNGTSDYVSINDSPSFTATDRTITAWIKNTGSGIQLIAEQLQSNGTGSWGTYVDSDGTLRFFGLWSSPVDNDSNFSVRDNKWHHIVITRSDTNDLRTFYVDGVSVATAADTQTGTSDPNDKVYIGARGSTPEFYFNGLLDDVRIYNRALSAAEILNLYNLGKSRY